MKAVICTGYGPPEVLQIQDIEKPIPKADEVMVKIHATTVTAADYRVRSFSVPLSFWLPARLMLGLRRPRKAILGMELSGAVEAVGADVSTFKPGDPVFAASLQSFGAYAEYISLPATGPVALKPNNLSFKQAAAVPIGARTALYYLQTIGQIQAGQKILIYGASGSVGTYAVQLAKYFGAEVTAVCSTANLELVQSLGANKVIDYTTKGYTESFESYDLIFVTVDKCPFKACKKALRDKGVYLNIGRPLPSLSMIWASLSGRIKIAVGKTPPETVDALVTLKFLIESGKLQPVIDRIYSLDEIVEAHRYVDQGHKKGNVVIGLSPEEGHK